MADRRRTVAATARGPCSRRTAQSARPLPRRRSSMVAAAKVFAAVALLSSKGMEAVGEPSAEPQIRTEALKSERSESRRIDDNVATASVDSSAVDILHADAAVYVDPPGNGGASTGQRRRAGSGEGGSTGIRGGADGARSEEKRERVHFVRRLYGPENAAVRREIHRIETESTEYWRTGVKGDPAHRVEYKNHPFDAMARKREAANTKERARMTGDPDEPERWLQEADAEADADEEDEETVEFKPLRIQFWTAALEAQRSASNGAQIDFILNEILPKMGTFWSETLSVVPVEGKLLMSAAELANREFCGDSEFTRVPAEHMSDGVDGTDIILYVSGTPSTRFCGPSTLAVAVACNFDNFDRPIAGAINFCLDQVELDEDGTASEAIISDNVDVAIHEAAHVLGMSSNSYRFYWNPETGEQRTNRNFRSSTVTCVDGVQRTAILPAENTMKFFVAANGQRYAAIVTEKVAQVARNQFDCQELEGGQLENQPTGADSCTGDHWEERLYYPEALSGVISPNANIISPLTLALMEDSGWYKANYTKASVSPFGHGVGCDFVNKPCLETDSSTGETVVPDYSQSFFCAKASARGCSPSHTHKMACTVIDYSLFFPQKFPDPQFAYFQDAPSQGGPRQADYCPVYGSTYSGLQPEQLDCREPGNVDLINLYSEDYGEDSMCFETTSGEGRCYIAQCIQDDLVLKVNIRGEWKTCEYDFQQIDIQVASGAISSTLTCPRIMSACPDMFCPANCAGRGVCNYKADVNGTTRPKCECFDPEDTSPGCSDSLTLEGKYLQDSSGLIDDLSAGIFEPLVAVFVDNPDTWTTASWAWAAGLFVVFLLMLLCICSSFWPKRGMHRRRKNF